MHPLTTAAFALLLVVTVSAITHQVITIEAEDGALEFPMTAYAGSPLPGVGLPSGGLYTAVKTNNNYQPVDVNGTYVCRISGYEPPGNNDHVVSNGFVSAAFTLVEPAVIKVVSRVLVPRSSANSFFLTVASPEAPGAPLVPHTEWHLDDAEDWIEATIPTECLIAPAGALNVTLQYRERDTAVDWIRVTTDFAGPRLVNLRGCPTVVDLATNSSRMACPSSGTSGTLLQIVGTNFCGLGMVAVDIDGVPASIVSFAPNSGCNADAIHPDGTHVLLVELPRLAGTNRLLSVVVNDKRASLPISFAPPVVTAVTGCGSGASDSGALVLTNCARSGGDRITLYGTDLGYPGANVSVMIGSEVCTDITHPLEAKPTEAIECSVPPGTSTDLRLSVSVEGQSPIASYSRAVVSLSYFQVGCNAHGCSGNGACDALSGACSCNVWFRGERCTSDTRIVILLPVLLVALGCCLTVIGVIFYRRKAVTYKLTSDSSLVIEPDALSVGRKVGHGSYGVVFAGVWRSTPVAVKQMHAKTLKPAQLREFVDEASMLLRLRHPNIVIFMGVTLEPPAIVTEFMPRGSLYDVLHAPNIFLDSSIVFKWAHQMAQGLQFLAHSDVVHGDFKSLNVLFDSNWMPKICDFGMASVKGDTGLHAVSGPSSSKKGKQSRRRSRATARVGPSATASTTRTSSMHAISLGSLRSKSGTGANGSKSAPGAVANVGTLFWAAPEVLVYGAAGLSTAADAFAFGVTLWELASRDHPYAGENPLAVALEVVEGRRLPLTAVPPNLQPLVGIITGLFVGEPESRTTLDNLIAELSTLYDSSAVIYPTTAAKPSGRIILAHAALLDHEARFLIDPMDLCAELITFHSSFDRITSGAGCAIIARSLTSVSFSAHTPSQLATVLSHLDAFAEKSVASLGMVVASETITSTTDDAGTNRLEGPVVALVTRLWLHLFGSSAAFSLSSLAPNLASAAIADTKTPPTATGVLPVRRGVAVTTDLVSQLNLPDDVAVSPVIAWPKPPHLASPAAASYCLVTSDDTIPGLVPLDSAVGSEDISSNIVAATAHTSVVLASSYKEGSLPAISDAGESSPSPGFVKKSFALSTGTIAAPPVRQCELPSPSLSTPFISELSNEVPSPIRPRLAIDPKSWMMPASTVHAIVSGATRTYTGSYAKIYESDWKGRPVIVKIMLRQSFKMPELINLVALAGRASRGARPGLVAPIAVSVFEPYIGLVFPHYSAGGLNTLLDGAATKSKSSASTPVASIGNLRVPLNAYNVRTILISTALSLYRLHTDVGMAHGSLKPANILLLLNTDGSVLEADLTDFGLSGIKANLGTMTVVPTVAYTSPQALRGNDESLSSDIFVFGTLIYELSSRSPAFTGSNALEVAHRILNSVFPDTLSLPPALARLVEECWAEDPAERPDAANLLARLQALDASHYVLKK
ncbi:TKL protein kinase [Thecamonas trahens ATCC 50062]|uniref:TKL protein kinase n=1 Tax=Thecamonas trahens ATCC 50062 TaxID=461836 RepID=A0A0L0D194_THETB|nr:TKL protein kinase [Thecamonas trahens ATCC 50062]KNC46012.1 TKL protein kinase [Thecamonas trahens ATCC 50062]|eukprot:XP_013762992.1 TKL protein kinase [Thecamonas trahens ATCC 50062]